MLRVVSVIDWPMRWPKPSIRSDRPRRRSDCRDPKTSAMVCMRPPISLCARTSSATRGLDGGAYSAPCAARRQPAITRQNQDNGNRRGDGKGGLADESPYGQPISKRGSFIAPTSSPIRRKD